MNLSKPLQLQVLWKNADACQLEDLGIATTYIPETKPIMLYSVDYISHAQAQGLDYETAFISSGGEEFATLMSYQELVSLVAEYL